MKLPKPSITSLPSRIAEAYRQVQAEKQTPLVFARPHGQDATIGVLDVFRTSAEDQALHGDKVSAVIQNQGFAADEVSHISSTLAPETKRALSDLLYAESAEPFESRLDTYIELAAGQTLSKTNGILKQLAARSELGLKTINQSQGESRSGIYKLLLNAAWNGTDENGKSLITQTGREMAQAHGMDADDPDFSPWKFEQNLIERVGRVVDRSTYIEELQKEHSDLLDQLGEQGVSVVTSAGNDNDDYMATRNVYNHQISETFDDDITSVGKKLVVGALDTKGTPETSDDEIAYFSSRYGAVTLLADGIDVPTLPGLTATGSSYAAPQVAASLERLRRTNPDRSVADLQKDVGRLFRATDGYNILPDHRTP